VERFRDGLRQELRMILIAIQFQSVQDLVRAAQGMKRVMRDAPKLVVQQSEATGAKRRDFGFSTKRPPLPKKGKSRQSLGQFQRRGGRYTPKGSLEDLDRLVKEDPTHGRVYYMTQEDVRVVLEVMASTL